ncbi:MAG: hypothetical protein AAGM22_19425 [Acidobacteriota bacterium]
MKTTDLTLRLPAEDARVVSLVRAVDETDRLGELLPVSERQQLTQAAFGDVDLAPLKSAEGTIDADGADRKALKRLEAPLADRAREIGEALSRHHSELGALLRSTWAAGPTAGLLILAVIAGALSNVLGPSKAVSVLAPPLLGLIVWNVLVFLILSIGTVRRLLLPPDPKGSLPVRFEGLIRRWSARSTPVEGGVLSRVVTEHRRAWFRAALPLEAARWSGRFHLAAAALVISTVVGMYARGLAFEYRATWESTFLSAGTVDAILGFVLWPAQRILILDLPTVESLRAPASGSAAPWIHAWAMSAVLLVVVPRLALAGRAALHAWRLRRRLPLSISPSYVRRIVATASTTPHEVQILPYSYRPVERSTEVLRRAVLDFLGARAVLRIGSTLGYGDAPPPSSAAWRIVLFNLAQTPEVEVHGELLGQLAGELADGQRLLVLVDEAPFLDRVPGSQRAERRESRRRAWLRNLAASTDDGVAVEVPAPVFLALDDELDPDLAVDALTRGAWPPGAGGGPP